MTRSSNSNVNMSSSAFLGKTIVALVLLTAPKFVLGETCRGSPQFATCKAAASTKQGCQFFQGCDWDFYCQDNKGVYFECCEGQMMQCQDFQSESDCYKQPGCTWARDAIHTVSSPGPSGCFSGDNTVQVWNGPSASTKKMKDLQVGDLVLTSDTKTTNAFQPVYAFGHLDPVSSLDFIKISFGGDGDEEQQFIELTPDHMIYLDHGKSRSSTPVRADTVKVGHHIIYNGRPKEVTKIAKLHKRGLYAPLTQDGTIVVNGVLASTYVALNKMSDTEEIKVHGMTLPFVDQTYGIHLAISPLRIACTMTGSSLGLCKGEYDNLEGINPYVAWGMDMIEWIEGQTAFVQVIVIYAFVSAFLVLNSLESLVLGSGAAPFVLVKVVLLLASVAFVTLRGGSKKSKTA